MGVWRARATAPMSASTEESAREGRGVRPVDITANIYIY